MSRGNETSYGDRKLLRVEHDERGLLLHLQVDVNGSGKDPLLQVDVVVVNIVTGW